MKLIWLLILHFCVLGFTNSLCLGQDVASPNIVLIISDDQAWSDYGFMAHPDIKTPNIDKLAAQSAVFRRGYVPTALCRPSLATLLTGHYASTHGITGNDPSPKYAKRDSKLYNERRTKLISYIDRFDTLPELLGKQGYLSHQSGKYWEGSFRHGGFTHGMTRGYPEKGGRHGDDGLRIGRSGMEEIRDFVRTARGQKKPFFLWYAPYLPHTPHNPPERLLKKYRAKGLPITIAKYYAMVEWFDETCGQLLGILNEAGVRKDTLIVYVTDNGWIQNSESNGYGPRSKQTPYEAGVRTLILYSWPEKISSGERSELTSSIDIVPTILAAGGAEIPAGLPGLNLLANLTENQPIERNAIFGESFAHDIADIEKPEASLLFRWVIKGDWKLLLTYDGEVNRYKSTHPRKEKRPQLFNLKEDPHEKKNRAGEAGDVVAQLVMEIDNWYPVKERKVLKVFK